jgi:hypothetical protein
LINDGLKVLNIGGIKLSTCQSLGLKSRDTVDDRCGGVPHVARFVQQGFEGENRKDCGIREEGFLRGWQVHFLHRSVLSSS